jgi:hypothetical protein
MQVMHTLGRLGRTLVEYLPPAHLIQVRFVMPVSRWVASEELFLVSLRHGVAHSQCATLIT